MDNHAAAFLGEFGIMPWAEETPVTTKPAIINLWAPPGVGKSTTMAGIFAFLKRRAWSVELAPEFAKDLTYEANHRALSDPFYIMGNQEYRNSRLRGQVEHIVTDSPPGLAAVYCKPADITMVLMLARHMRGRYRNFDVILERDPRRTYQEYGRNQTKEESEALEGAVHRTVGLLAEEEPFHTMADPGAPVRILEWFDREVYDLAKRRA